MLGLSNLWFNYGHIYVVYMAISEELKSSPIDPWLKVIITIRENKRLTG